MDLVNLKMYDNQQPIAVTSFLLCLKSRYLFIYISKYNITFKTCHFFTQIVEGAAGVSIGAYMTNMEKFSGQNVVIISCGGNLSLSILNDIVSKYKSK